MGKHNHTDENDLELLEAQLTSEENEANGHVQDTEEGDITLTDTTPQAAAPVIDWVETASESELRSLIFQTADLEEKLVEVPEWKIKVLVRALTGKERTNLVKDCMMKDGTMDVSKLYPALVVMTTRHPLTNKPIFKPADRDMLLNKAGSVLDRIALVAAQISGLSQNAATDATKN